ncbi:MAG: hypothetical protein HYU75_10710, partial [Betaproteobacteria bacterium]|nr:hypothetical protein [Betaproteobacteria bacterium]
MPFHRFEDFESSFLTPHLSTGKAPVIEGGYLYFACCTVVRLAPVVLFGFAAMSA